MCFAATLLPAAFALSQAAQGELGAEPLKTLIFSSGDWSIRLLLATLLVTPLRHILGRPRICLLRRQLGQAALFYALTHLALFAMWQGSALRALQEMVLRPYLVVGGIALLGLAVLGVTSSDAWLRRLRHRWKTLHRLVFPLAVLAIAHDFMQTRIDASQPVLLAGCLLWLVLWRCLPARIGAKAPTLLALSLFCAAAAAGLEFGWYALATGINPLRVLVANASFAAGPRPAVLVGALGLVISAASLLTSAKAAARSMARVPAA